jgi:hypothetical protein
MAIFIKKKKGTHGYRYKIYKQIKKNTTMWKKLGRFIIRDECNIYFKGKCYLLRIFWCKKEKNLNQFLIGQIL